MKFTLHTILVFTTALSINAAYSQQITEPLSTEPTEEWMTILVHGTIMPYINLFDLKTMSNSRLPPDLKIVHIHNAFRRTPFFFLAQPIQGIGLKPIYFSQDNKESAAQGFAKIFQTFNNQFQPSRTINHFYTYGWSGLLNDYARDQGAEILWNSLVKEVKKLQQETANQIHICLVGYSYGGLVCLELARHRESTKSSLIIDELVLFATPVRYENYLGIHSPLFKKIYHLYSDGDRVQDFDFLSCSRPNKVFDSKISYDIVQKDLPPSLTQIKIQFNRRTTGFKENKYYSSFAKKRACPGHIEMWFFGWTSKWYRPHFPITPLPVAALTPYITKTADEYKVSNDICMEISPKSEQTIITNLQGNECSAKIFVSNFEHKQIMDAQKTALHYRPHNYKERHKKRWHELLVSIDKRIKRKRIATCKAELAKPRTSEQCRSTTQVACS